MKEYLCSSPQMNLGYVGQNFTDLCFRISTMLSPHPGIRLLTSGDSILVGWRYQAWNMDFVHNNSISADQKSGKCIY